ncbi:LysR family transcriptional regulator [Clostridium sp. MCC353]|uniref:LysR family transcriptional regulator n=1 Tax=Clostridium sp. MCC353 TaxID=2592646 RepID=UPI001C01C583|nr:LysR family transcriptional regulator [Clostridium sp. MCC353]MBT9778430.1 LysR family transcriptional regulator [Clostridium sp. MCC353]
MNLLQFEYFLELAKLQNMTSAAESLHISQPALSNMLKKLEAELGVPLFDRKGKNLKLNENGREFQKTISGLFEILERNQQKMLYRDKLGVQEIVLGFRTSEARFSGLLNTFMELHPNIVFRLISNQRTVKSKPEDTLDFLFSHRSVHLRNMNYVFLSDSEPSNPYILLNRTHPLCQKKCLDPDDIKDERMIVVSPHSNALPVEYNTMLNYGIMPNICAITDDRFVMLNMITSGTMIGLVPYIDSCFVKNNTNVAVRPLAPGGSVHIDQKNIYFAWKKDNELSEAALEFRSFMFQQFNLTEEDIKYLP